MSGNTFGKLFTVTTAGESHGPALVAIVDGCPPGLELSLDDLQRDLDRRHCHHHFRHHCHYRHRDHHLLWHRPYP